MQLSTFSSSPSTHSHLNVPLQRNKMSIFTVTVY